MAAKRILIIDNDPDIQEYLMAILEDHGYLTHGVAVGESIPEVVRREQPDLIILDIMLAERSGVSVYKSLRSSPDFEAIPIALLSGVIFESDSTRSGLLELLQSESIPLPNRFIEKPINLKAFVESINDLIG